MLSIISSKTEIQKPTLLCQKKKKVAEEAVEKVEASEKVEETTRS